MSCVPPMRPMGCRPMRRGCASGECIRVLIAPGATAFARASRLAYSIAIERMTALRPPLIKGLEGHRACFPGGHFLFGLPPVRPKYVGRDFGLSERRCLLLVGLRRGCDMSY
jgi:hypothetical protein